MRVFGQIERPYYRYGYNRHHTETIETEDCAAHRKFWEAGIPLFCAWDWRAGHFKEVCLDVPDPLPSDLIPEYFMKKARAQILAEMAEEESRKARTIKPVVVSAGSNGHVDEVGITRQSPDFNAHAHVCLDPHEKSGPWTPPEMQEIREDDGELQ